MSNKSKEHYVRLVQQHEGIIHKVIGLHIDAAEDKKDVYQEILLQAWKSFEKFEGRSSFSTWLYRVALNTVFSYKKTEQKKSKADQVAMEQAETMQTGGKESYELLYQLVRQLDEVDRSLMTLHLDGYKNKEIAEILGMTSNHVNVKIHRLKNHIVEQFKKANHGSI